MWHVCYVMPDRTIGIVCYQNVPAVLPSEEDAWAVVDKFMSQPEHPRLMWIRKVVEENEDVLN